jgi:hypothetical protein
MSTLGRTIPKLSSNGENLESRTNVKPCYYELTSCNDVESYFLEVFVRARSHLHVEATLALNARLTS